MRITPDTNILVRAIVDDDPETSPRARALLEQAEEVVLTVVALAELDWVLRKQLKWPRELVVEVIRRMTATANVRCHRWTVDEGLAALEAGADFADGVIAYDGAWQHGETFVTLDRKAAAVVSVRGGEVLLLD
ncbi:MAG: VapC toxin family PIN domain ribonuclease [Leifsonia xyli]|nr:MAG: VapC toxin family PIN domain ribonuclease [Leifsonia xyli]